MAFRDILIIVIIQRRCADVLIHLAFHVPGASFVIRSLGRELDVRQLDDDLQTAVAEVSDEVDIFVSFGRWWWRAEDSGLGGYGFTDGFFPVFSPLPEVVFVFVFFLGGLLGLGDGFGIGIEC